MALPQANPLPLLNNESSVIRPSMRVIERALHLWHLASFDAPSVAVVWTIAFANVAGVQLKAWVFTMIACTTWSVYVADRLLDARRAMRSGALNILRERHYFHWHHRRWLLPSACVAAAIAALLILNRMPSAARHRDSVLAAAALLYFSGVHSSTTLPRWIRNLASKEFLVGLLFTAGCAAPALTRVFSISWPFILCLASFTALAWLNCSAIARWESPGSTPAFAIRPVILSIACFASAAALSFADARASGLICMAGISALLLVLLDHTRRRISSTTLRSLADVVLLTPLIPLAISALPR